MANQLPNALQTTIPKRVESRIGRNKCQSEEYRGRCQNSIERIAVIPLNPRRKSGNVVGQGCRNGALLPHLIGKRRDVRLHLRPFSQSNLLGDLKDADRTDPDRTCALNSGYSIRTEATWVHQAPRPGVRVEQNIQGSAAFPEPQLLIGKRLKEIRAVLHLIRQHAHFELTLWNGHKTHDRLRSFGDHNLFAAQRRVDQF